MRQENLSICGYPWCHCLAPTTCCSSRRNTLMSKYFKVLVGRVLNSAKLNAYKIHGPMDGVGKTYGQDQNLTLWIYKRIKALWLSDYQCRRGCLCHDQRLCSFHFRFTSISQMLLCSTRYLMYTYGKLMFVHTCSNCITLDTQVCLFPLNPVPLAHWISSLTCLFFLLKGPRGIPVRNDNKPLIVPLYTSCQDHNNFFYPSHPKA